MTDLVLPCQSSSDTDLSSSCSTLSQHHVNMYMKSRNARQSRRLLTAPAVCQFDSSSAKLTSRSNGIRQKLSSVHCSTSISEGTVITTPSSPRSSLRLPLRNILNKFQLQDLSTCLAYADFKLKFVVTIANQMTSFCSINEYICCGQLCKSCLMTHELKQLIKAQHMNRDYVTVLMYYSDNYTGKSE